jgi:MarR family transcriptional regulator, transcriptional regulator for hemolysin
MDKPADTSFAYRMHDVTCLFRKHFDRRALRFGLTRAQWRALKAIRRDEGLSQIALADRLELEAIAVGRVIDRLQDAGFVQRRADPADRRRWRLHLTPKAHAVTDDMEVLARELRGESLRDIEAVDLDAFLRVLARIHDNLVALDEGNAATPPSPETP